MISLIVGLGNPGDEYTKTRHNVGFLLLDTLARQEGVTFAYEAKFNATVAKYIIDGKTVHLIKPQTYMNRSGQPVSSYAKYFDIPAVQIMVVHDDLDLAPGTVRLKDGGGHGGHNGLRDIVSQLSSKDFYRLRIGIGHPGDRNRVSSYVLKPPGKVDAGLISSAVDEGVGEMQSLCKGDFQAVMQRLHTQ